MSVEVQNTVVPSSEDFWESSEVPRSMIENPASCR